MMLAIREADATEPSTGVTAGIGAWTMTAGVSPPSAWLAALHPGHTYLYARCSSTTTLAGITLNTRRTS